MKKSAGGLPKSFVLTVLCASMPWVAGAAEPDAPAAPAAAPAASPAPTATSELQEIVVTAQRHTTLLKDTPVSIEAFTGDRLDAQGVRSMDDLTRLTPGVTFQRNGVTATGNYNDENSDIAVRGIDSSAGASTTAVYIDDTPIQTRHLSFGTLNAFPAIFDLDRVEVLRGPQGTLFGSGAEGGAVRFLQPEPSLKTTSLYSRAEIAETKSGAPSYEAGAAIGVPLATDSVGLRLSASYRKDGGFVDRVNVIDTNPGAAFDPSHLKVTGTAASNANYQETATVRAALKFAVGKDTTITPSVYFQRLTLGDTSAYWTALSDPGSSNFVSGNARPNTSVDPFSIWSVKVDSDLGFAQFVSNTSYLSRSQSSVSDYTQFLGTLLLLNPTVTVAGGPSTASFTDVQYNVVQEFRLNSIKSDSPLSWVGGLYLAHLHENTTEEILAQGTDATVLGTSQANIYHQDPYEAVDKQYALFGSVDYKLTPSLTLTAGLRIASMTVSGDQSYSGAFVGPVGVTANQSFTEHPVTPKLVANWKADPDDMFYASAAKGYRVGGINSALGQICAHDLNVLGLSNSPPTYQSDSLWSYELGAKNTLLNHRLQLDTSIYYIDWSNIQQSVYLPTCGLQFAANLGKATSKGFDVSARVKATSNLLLTVEAGYTDARYARSVTVGTTGAGAPIVTQGDVLDPVPWNLNISGEYQIPGFDVVNPYVRADYQFTSGQMGLQPVQDSSNGSYDPNYVNVTATRNLSLRGGARWDNWDLSLFANNLLNAEPQVVHSHDTAGSPLYFDRSWRPRTIGVTGIYRF